MKYTMLSLRFSFVVGFFYCFAVFADSPTVKSPTTMPSPDNVATDQVVAFYKALLQKEPPTIEQERAIFTETSVLRHQLVLGKGGPQNTKDIEPMKRTPEDRKKRLLEDKQVVAAGPVVLKYFREHKNWFLPIGMKTPNEISISSLSNFVRSLDHAKDSPKAGSGFVLAVFIHDRTAPPMQIHKRTVVFTLCEGKIVPDGIGLDGFDERKFVLVEGLKE
jgi:hypothetical protein